MDNHECRAWWIFSVAGKSQENREDGGEEYYNVVSCHHVHSVWRHFLNFPTSTHKNKYFISWQTEPQGQPAPQGQTDPQTKSGVEDGLCHQKLVIVKNIVVLQPHGFHFVRARMLNLNKNMK